MKPSMLFKTLLLSSLGDKVKAKLREHRSAALEALNRPVQATLDTDFAQ